MLHRVVTDVHARDTLAFSHTKAGKTGSWRVIVFTFWLPKSLEFWEVAEERGNLTGIPLKELGEGLQLIAILSTWQPAWHGDSVRESVCQWGEHEVRRFVAGNLLQMMLNVTAKSTSYFHLILPRLFVVLVKLIFYFHFIFLFFTSYFVLSLIETFNSNKFSRISFLIE